MNQQTALEILKSGKNVFLTGSAGSGKTHTLNTYIHFLRSQGADVAVTASTGIASTHLGGRTIHSWSGIGIRDHITPAQAREIISHKRLRKRLRKINTLIIDEISMIDARVLNMVECMLKEGRKKPLEPFGGVQIVVCGDFFQLPPVVSSQKKMNVSLFGQESESVFAYTARSWQEACFSVCYLDEQYRHTKGDFFDILNAIRSGKGEEKAQSRLEDLVGRVLERSDDITHLYTHNFDVDRINEARLRMISAPSKRYRMKSLGRVPLVASLKQSCLAQEECIVKEGASVMFVKNDVEGKYVNGTLGIVTGFDDEHFPIVTTRSGVDIIARPQAWQLEEEEVVLAEIRQIPLRLAWAITIHKSQGMTLDAAKMDLSKAFVPGMGYVALSRVRSLEGLELLGINKEALCVHPDVLEQDKEFFKDSQEEELSWKELPSEIKKQKQRFFKRTFSGKKKDIF